MKKEELIKKAASHGITLDDISAEKYKNLSDEELANLDISGGTNCDSDSKADNKEKEKIEVGILPGEQKKSIQTAIKNR
ncbi:MAG: hypothetical protein LBL80_01080 [Ruminococcus sp.]|jgi:hypothetical protein|nr:hypothetical protein [Ruminococcus sp.]